MSRAKKEPISEEYRHMQLSEAEIAELRRNLQADIERARAAGVYERLLALRGKVKFDLPWELMRDKE